MVLRSRFSWVVRVGCPSSAQSPLVGQHSPSHKPQATSLGPGIGGGSLLSPLLVGAGTTVGDEADDARAPDHWRFTGDIAHQLDQRVRVGPPLGVVDRAKVLGNASVRRHHDGAMRSWWPDRRSGSTAPAGLGLPARRCSRGPRERTPNGSTNLNARHAGAGVTQVWRRLRSRVIAVGEPLAPTSRSWAGQGRPVRQSRPRSDCRIPEFLGGRRVSVENLVGRKACSWPARKLSIAWPTCAINSDRRGLWYAAMASLAACLSDFADTFEGKARRPEPAMPGIGLQS
jgi:hypothetical protein